MGTLAVYAGSVGTTVVGGSLALAVPVAAAAGLVSFLSPCVLPLVPGYLSYVTGLSGADMAAHRRGRMLTGGALFVGGFTIVFVATGVAFGQVGSALAAHADVITRVLGAVTILLGLMFMGALRIFQRDLRLLHRRPAAGLVGAPLLGILFGFGWTPCIGPTLAAVQSLAFSEASAVRGALLSAVYCVGLGVPFVLTALAYRRALGAFSVVKRHYRTVTAVGGGLLVVIGLLLVTGLWTDLTAMTQQWAASFQTVI